MSERDRVGKLPRARHRGAPVSAPSLGCLLLRGPLRGRLADLGLLEAQQGLGSTLGAGAASGWARQKPLGLAQPQGRRGLSLDALRLGSGPQRSP